MGHFSSISAKHLIKQITKYLWINFHYTISALDLRWFDSYLDGRHQAILSETGLTEFITIQYGLPQRSILGPTFFLIFIDDLALNFDFCLSDIYADDGTVHIHDKTLKPLKSSY